MNDIPPHAEAPEAAKVEEMLSDAGSPGRGFLESERGIPLLTIPYYSVWANIIQFGGGRVSFYLGNFNLIKIKVVKRGEPNFYEIRTLVPMPTYYNPHHHPSSSREGHVSQE